LNWRQQSQLNFPTKRLREAYAYDYNLFEAYAAYTTGTLYQEVSDLSDANLEALISIESHRLEKGLSHHQRRANFGTDAADRLHAALAAAKARDLDSEITGYAQSVLQSYWGEIDQDDGEHVGWKRISREQVLNSASIRAPEFFESRHSIRCFDPQRKVDRSLILKAIRQARFTPSVCNRQTWRVVLCETEEAKAKALPLQNGNLGFGHLASHVLIIASDRNCFASIGERNQPWIEAGMFAMSLVYALHAQGLGTCCLNWSAEPEKDRALKIELALPESLAIGMMIAVGALRGEILVAESRRLSLELMTITR
jgi:nitroreductase